MRIMRTLGFVLVVAFASSSFTAEADPPVEARGQIAFTREGDVWLLDLASGREERHVDDLDHDRPLAWSPDGARLVYWKHPTTGWELWSLTVETGQRKQLTPKEWGGCRSPAFSPDGKRIAFWRTVPPGFWISDRDGKNPQRVSEDGHRDHAPVWSPDGRSLAFVTLRSLARDRVATDLMLAQRGGDTWIVRKLTAGEPKGWSADGRWLFAECARAGSHEICRIEAATGKEQNLTRSPEHELLLTVSPDGGRLAFVRAGPRKDRSLWVMAADGSNAKRLATLHGRLSAPSWSGDGRFLAYVSAVEGRSELFTVGIDGGTPTQRTKNGAVEIAWRPR